MGRSQLTHRFGLNSTQAEESLRNSGLLRKYEKFGGLASGGSESLVFFVVGTDGAQLVRKVSSSGFSYAAWDRRRVGVMSDPYKRARQQVDYLQRLPPEVAELFPRLHRVVDTELDGDFGYRKALITDYERVDGLSISDCVGLGELDERSLPKVYRDLAQLLAEKVHTVGQTAPTRPSVEDFHLRKMDERIQLARRSWPEGMANISPDQPWIYVNGYRYRSVWHCIETIRSEPALMAALEPPSFTLVMGDCNTQNIFLTRAPYQGTKMPTCIKLLDPRGIGPAWSRGMLVDDPLYDWKYWHNSLAHYDMIYSGQLQIAMGTAVDDVPWVTIASRDDLAYEKTYRHIAASFEEVISVAAGTGQTLENRYGRAWRLRFLFLMGSHFAAMLPFHLHRNPTRDVAGASVLAMYCESVRWLNAALDYWNGDISFSDVLKEPWPCSDLHEE